MSIKIRLIIMNFLQFFIWGSWLISLGGYMGRELHFEGGQIGAIFATMGISSLFMPGIVGIIADKWMNAERLYGLCHLLGAAFLFYASTVTGYKEMYWAMLLNLIVYMPTLALANTVSYNALEQYKLDLIKDYEENDLRKDFSVKFASDPQVNDWFVTKFRDVSTAAGTTGWGGNDWILIRYADVMLLLAEAKMNLGKSSEAVVLVNEVRSRAGLPSYQEAQNDPIYKSKYPTLKDAILHERRVELAFENQRWFDLIRNYTAQELVDYFKKKRQADYGNAKISNISTKDRYYPIPFDEYKLNPEKMYQNSGY